MARAAAIAFIGCGQMGLPLVVRLLGAGRHIRAFDVSDEALARARRAGAESTTSAAAAAEGAGVVVTMLPDPAAVDAVAGDVLSVLVRDALWLEMTSSHPRTTRSLAQAAAKREAKLLDAPVSGGVSGAEDGTLTIMVGGPADVLEEARALLEIVGERIVHVGERPGDGDLAKTINNMLSATNLAAAAEALALGVREGLDPARLVETINGSSGSSHATQVKLPRHVLPGRYDSRFSLDQYVKDLRIALDVAAEAGVPAAVASAARAVWSNLAARGHGGDDHTALVPLVLRDAGVGEATRRA